jgi:hypothetical protein
MRKILLIIGILCCGAIGWASDKAIDIPLHQSVFRYMPQDSPTGSTPDPTDPNQFRASLTGNMLHIETQAGQVSYVVIEETKSDAHNEDYFYGISLGSITCPITHAGTYTIRIGYWKTDFTGKIIIKRVCITDLNGHLMAASADKANLPTGTYIIWLQTSLGSTSSKIHILPW